MPHDFVNTLYPVALTLHVFLCCHMFVSFAYVPFEYALPAAYFADLVYFLAFSAKHNIHSPIPALAYKASLVSTALCANQ